MNVLISDTERTIVAGTVIRNGFSSPALAPLLTDEFMADLAYATTLPEDDFYLNPDNVDGISFRLFDYVSVNLFQRTGEAVTSDIIAAALLSMLGQGDRIPESHR